MIEWIVAGASSLTSLGAIIWLTVGRIHDAHALTAANSAAVDAEGRVERAEFENKTLRAALTESQRRNRILAEAFNAEIARNPNADLDADDVAGRMRRLEILFATDDGVSAGSGGGSVSVDASATPPEADELPAEPATELR